MTIAATLVLPMPVLNPPGNNIIYVAPAPQLAAFAGASAFVLAPMADLSATAFNAAGANSFTYTAPAPKLSAYFGSSSALLSPTPTLAVAATFVGLATAALAAPAPTLNASGTNTVLSSGAFAAPMAKIVGYTGAVVSITIDGYTIAATGTSGSISSAALTMPLFDLTATGSARNQGRASLLIPMPVMGSTVGYLLAPMAQLTAIGSAVVTVTYEAYALNLNHIPSRENPQPVDELTRYTNYPFDRIVRYKNSYFGMNATGLYLLEGTTDYAVTPTDVAWSFKTAMTDFDSVKQKNVSMAYFGGRMGPAATVSVYVGESTTSAYSYATPRGATAQNYRQPLGLGMKARYYAFGATGTGELTLDSLSLNVTELSRKV